MVANQSRQEETVCCLFTYFPTIVWHRAWHDYTDWNRMISAWHVSAANCLLSCWLSRKTIWAHHSRSSTTSWMYCTWWIWLWNQTANRPLYFVSGYRCHSCGNTVTSPQTSPFCLHEQEASPQCSQSVRYRKPAAKTGNGLKKWGFLQWNGHSEPGLSQMNYP